MIREKAILGKLNNLNITDNELFSSFKPEKTVCPGCGALGRLSPHGSYQRDMISIANDGRAYEKVTIGRAICASCGITHALLPDILVPHGSHTLRFIIHVLRAYLNRDGTVEALCGRFQIAISTLYRWIKRFRQHTNLLLLAFRQISGVTNGAIDFISGIKDLPRSFSDKFGFSFLQNQKLRTGTDGPG